MTLDVEAFLADRGDAVRFIHGLLTATLGRPALTGCFGLHEWAMVYRETDEHRHPLPLRLGSAGTDAVVETHRIRCTHFDAYRFFTPDAVERNTLRPTRDLDDRMEQPGCLHAGMDVYKWATKLGPAVPGDLLLDCFELARDIRTLDMQASPYDVTTYGLDPVAIETPEGKARVRRAAAGVRRARERPARAPGRGVRGAARLRTSAVVPDVDDDAGRVRQREDPERVVGRVEAEERELLPLELPAHVHLAQGRCTRA